jgi:hypothetical protein
MRTYPFEIELHRTSKCASKSAEASGFERSLALSIRSPRI